MPVAIFDMDGVLYRGSIVMPYAQKALARLRKAGWQVFFATNNSTATRDEYVTRLATLGLGGDLEHVVTSAYATAHYLERLVPKPKDPRRRYALMALVALVFLGVAMILLDAKKRGLHDRIARTYVVRG